MSEASPGEGSLAAIRRYVLWGILFAGTLVICVGFWLFLATVSGAVIASGSVTVLSDVKKVQPPAGGVVARINVQNGQRVSAGEALILLDDTTARANLALAEKAFTEFDARRSRLIAELDGGPTVLFELHSFHSVPEQTTAQIRANETRLFELRKAAYDGRKAQLIEQVAQIEQEVSGNLRQIEANTV